ncbi:hypothetical protein SISSUDRAFT_1037703 [Sistotremastrum suecicum HHB10207 ss-3]|uniref:Uncharacterized protein n=1 Tax=Sistotremastrum suecicum HHB10207 ss-3 TaxID=1314776 RepID=A0A165XS25_9AGAM|nr:hypothetical protein SISSUDRAFT_1037703 [Sistotremastrum suecicum HHB10207 ss-3]
MSQPQEKKKTSRVPKASSKKERKSVQRSTSTSSKGEASGGKKRKPSGKHATQEVSDPVSKEAADQAVDVTKKQERAAQQYTHGYGYAPISGNSHLFAKHTVNFRNEFTHNMDDIARSILKFGVLSTGFIIVACKKEDVDKLKPSNNWLECNTATLLSETAGSYKVVAGWHRVCVVSKWDHYKTTFKDEILAEQAAAGELTDPKDKATKLKDCEDRLERLETLSAQVKVWPTQFIDDESCPHATLMNLASNAILAGKYADDKEKLVWVLIHIAKDTKFRLRPAEERAKIVKELSKNLGAVSQSVILDDDLRYHLLRRIQFPALRNNINARELSEGWHRSYDWFMTVALNTAFTVMERLCLNPEQKNAAHAVRPDYSSGSAHYDWYNQKRMEEINKLWIECFRSARKLQDAPDGTSMHLAWPPTDPQHFFHVNLSDPQSCFRIATSSFWNRFRSYCQAEMSDQSLSHIDKIVAAQMYEKIGRSIKVKAETLFFPIVCPALIQTLVDMYKAVPLAIQQLGLWTHPFSVSITPGRNTLQQYSSSPSASFGCDIVATRCVHGRVTEWHVLRQLYPVHSDLFILQIILEPLFADFPTKKQFSEALKAFTETASQLESGIWIGSKYWEVIGAHTGQISTKATPTTLTVANVMQQLQIADPTKLFSWMMDNTDLYLKANLIGRARSNFQAGFTNLLGAALFCHSKFTVPISSEEYVTLIRSHFRDILLPFREPRLIEDHKNSLEGSLELETDSSIDIPDAPPHWPWWDDGLEYAAVTSTPDDQYSALLVARMKLASQQNAHLADMRKVIKVLDDVCDTDWDVELSTALDDSIRKMLKQLDLCMASAREPLRRSASSSVQLEAQKKISDTADLTALHGEYLLNLSWPPPPSTVVTKKSKKSKTLASLTDDDDYDEKEDDDNRNDDDDQEQDVQDDDTPKDEDEEPEATAPDGEEEEETRDEEEIIKRQMKESKRLKKTDKTTAEAQLAAARANPGLRDPQRPKLSQPSSSAPLTPPPPSQFHRNPPSPSPATPRASSASRDDLEEESTPKASDFVPPSSSAPDPNSMDVDENAIINAPIFPQPPPPTMPVQSSDSYELDDIQIEEKDLQDIENQPSSKDSDKVEKLNEQDEATKIDSNDGPLHDSSSENPTDELSDIEPYDEANYSPKRPKTKYDYLIRLEDEHHLPANLKFREVGKYKRVRRSQEGTRGWEPANFDDMDFQWHSYYSKHPEAEYYCVSEKPPNSIKFTDFPISSVVRLTLIPEGRKPMPKSNAKFPPQFKTLHQPPPPLSSASSSTLRSSALKKNAASVGAAALPRSSSSASSSSLKPSTQNATTIFGAPTPNSKSSAKIPSQKVSSTLLKDQLAEDMEKEHDSDSSEEGGTGSFLPPGVIPSVGLISGKRGREPDSSAAPEPLSKKPRGSNNSSS